MKPGTPMLGGIIALAFIIASGATTASAQQPLPPSPPPKAEPKADATHEPKIEKKAEVSKSEKDFLQDAASFSLAELELAKLGKKLGRTTGVQTLAGQLTQAHTTIRSDIELLAVVREVELPKEPSVPQKTNLTRLESETGDAFDQLFMAKVANDHKKALMRYEKAAKHGLDPETRSLATRTLPLLKTQLDAAVKDRGADPVPEPQKTAAKGKDVPEPTVAPDP